VREFAAAALGDEAGEGLHVGADAVPLERCREELRDDEIFEFFDQLAVEGVDAEED
jgi:hypothetical protein